MVKINQGEVLGKRAISLRRNTPISDLSFSQELEYFILNEIISNEIGTVIPPRAMFDDQWNKACIWLLQSISRFPENTHCTW